MLTVVQLKKDMRSRLTPLYGEGEANAMVRLIFHSLKGWSATDLIIHEGDTVSDYLKGKTDEIISRLLRYEPIQYVLGEAYFFGMHLEVNPSVLIPRPETEQLVDIIIKENPGEDLRVLDVGTGSGAIAIALARNLPFSKVTAIDISEGALDTARRNAARLKTRINLIHADIFTFQPLAGSFDIIVSNPPYIAEEEKKGMEQNVLLYEPHTALFVPDATPLIFYSRIAETGKTALTEGGRLYFEINPRFVGAIIDMLAKEGYSDIKSENDSFGKTRFISAIKP